MKKQLKVLFVEDSESDALLLLRYLRQYGYTPVSERVDDAAGMSETLDRESWDIIICDFVMPRFSGLAALRLLQQKGLDLPCIIISGKAGEDIAVSAMKAGAQDFITKDNL
ncbi:MAG: response regulator, partial [Chloroflexi bacterium]|nr:response regulator [Chloroflexota bacterium]